MSTNCCQYGTRLVWKTAICYSFNTWSPKTKVNPNMLTHVKNWKPGNSWTNWAFSFHHHLANKEAASAAYNPSHLPAIYRVLREKLNDHFREITNCHNLASSIIIIICEIVGISHSYVMLRKKDNRIEKLHQVNWPQYF